MKKTRAIILAAGFGSRLMPYTSDKPKCMVKLFGKTILQHQLDVFHNNGINDIAVVAGYHPESVKHPDITHVFVNKDYNTTNMVESLMCARDWLESGDDIVISYGDIVYEDKVLKHALASNHDINVLVDKGWKDYWSIRMDNPLDDAESMKIGVTGAIKELGKKPKSYDDIQGQYIGLQLWRTQAIKKILALYNGLDKTEQYDGKPFPKMFMTSFIQAIIDQGLEVMPVFIENGWLEIDTVEDLNICEKLYAENALGYLFNVA